MAASMFRQSLKLSRLIRSNTPLLWRYSPTVNPQSTQVVISRTITQNQMHENQKIFFKRVAQFVGFGVFLYVISPWARQLKGAKFESRRDKKRRRLAAEQSEVENTGISYGEPSLNYQESFPPSRGILPVVKAADVTDFGTGYVTPRSQQFNFIADAVAKASPSVVFIEIHGRHPYQRGVVGPISNGSGFIVSPDGLILTNAHVVANKRLGKQSVKVKLYDGRLVDGKVVAVDPVSDLALLKIDTKDPLPVMRMGNSSAARPGEWVIAMGSPLSLSNTITAGIISTVSRTSKELGLNKSIDYIQTDAAINVGNSGGPLVNLDGEAIGINTMRVTTGISFAIPIDCARDFVDKVQKQMKASGGGWFGKSGPQGPVLTTPSKAGKQGYIGITMLSLTPSLIFDLRQRAPDFPNVSHGVLIYRITMESPAQVAGLKAGDIITHINDQPIKSSQELYDRVQAKESLKVTAVRGKETMKLTITPEESQ
ncbi:serine protease HTRA2, mitochondrial-like [Strongylocentrotus purpuratus]|uniref:Serine protease HTRA2, mitochondrial n=1 Tax=Strongylocentrotus purpuratus TaxID=7668 RepID=A0A7M7NUQ5_STRPU|nr:serine protease HTRA2, mitochondrial-like [Strongylocentrotus purpuratus]